MGNHSMTDAENKFKEWLDKRGYPYFYIEQSPETYPTFFRGLTKRPDFFVAIPYFGFIAVDVKEKEKGEKYSRTFTLNEENEVKKYLVFERIIGIPVWFVFCQRGEYDIWYWIPLSKVLECELKNGKNGKFRVIKDSDCIILQKEDTISRLIDKAHDMKIRK
jgi:hypothetical protein